MREHFLLDPDLVFLNHGSFGACPIEVLEYQRAIQSDLERNPCEFLGRRSARLLEDARATLAAYVGAATQDLVFVENATTGVNIAARTIDLAPGDEVLSCNLEYGACDAAWAVICKERGASYRRVPISLPFSAEAFTASMRDAFTSATRVLFLSHVTSSTALVLPLAELIAFAHARGVTVIIDGAHAPAFVDLDLDRLGADFYTGNCHKWMCAPKAVGFLHVARERQDAIDAPIISWGYMDAEDNSPRRLYVGHGVLAERLQWLGTRDPSSCLSVPAALAFLAKHAWPEQREERRELAYTTALAVADLVHVAPIASRASVGPMVALPLPDCDPERLRDGLFARHRIEMPVGLHEGRVLARISAHLYTTQDDMNRLLHALPAEIARAQ